MPEPLIQISNLVKTYETPAGPLSVLQGIDLEVERTLTIIFLNQSALKRSRFGASDFITFLVTAHEAPLLERQKNINIFQARYGDWYCLGWLSPYLK